MAVFCFEVVTVSGPDVNNVFRGHPAAGPVHGERAAGEPAALSVRREWN
jgi:hypothetical protein